jgi:multidrug efflux pump subunit AcrB
MDITINVISLFGMIVVVGILVDDGIVIAENIYQYYERGVPKAKAALEGTLSVLPAVFTAILTTVIAFSCFGFLDGRIGDIFSVLGVVVILSLIFSLVEGVFILPAHIAHSKALSKENRSNMLQRFFEKLMIWMREKFYRPVLRFSLRHPVTVAIGFTVCLILSVGLVQGGFVKTTVFPVIPRDNITIELKLPAGTREQITRQTLERIHAVADEVNTEFSKKYFNDEHQLISHIEMKIGPSTYTGSLDLSLLDSETRDSITAVLISNEIRDRLGPVPEAEVLTFAQPSPFGRPISISLLGNDYRSLQAAVVKIQKELETLEELRDVTNNNQEGLQEIQISLKEKALGLGITTQAVIQQVRQGFFGAEVQRLQRGEDEVRVWVRYGEEDRDDISRLATMRIRLPDGRSFPLADLADLKQERGVIAIYHLDGLREIKIEADISRNDVSVTDLLADIRTNIVPPILANYPTVKASFEGQNREQMKTLASAKVVLPIMLLLMFFTVAVTFRSLGQTVAVFALIPLGFIGVVVGHWTMGLQISLFSFLGILALVGIQVNDALVLVTTYNQRIQSGHRVIRSLMEASLSRFRPILLTTLTTVAGLGPLLLEKSFQAQFLIPMAVSVAFGLVLVTLLTLFLLPALILIMNQMKVWSVAQWEGRTPDHRMVESATDGRISYIWLWILFGVISILAFGALIMLTLKLTSLLIS